MNGAPRDQREENPLLTVAQLVLRHWFILGLLAALMVCSAWFYTRQQTKIYEARAQLIIDLAAPQYLSYQGSEIVSLGSNHWNTREFFETQFRIIRSRHLSQLVIERLSLQRDVDFLGLTELPEELQRKRLEQMDPALFLRGKIRVEPVAESQIAFIMVRDRDPERAALLANTIAETYQELNVNHKVSAAQEAVDWLQRKLSTLGEQRNEAAVELLAFKQRNAFFQSTLGERQNHLGLTLQDTERRLALAEQAARLASERAAQLRGGEESLELLQSPIIQRLKESQLELQNKRDELLTRYLEGHPSVEAISTQLTRVARAVDEERRAVQQGLRRSAEVARREVVALRAEVTTVKAEGRRLQAQELEYQRLEREVQGVDELYRQMELRLKEAELQAQSRANNVRILDRALANFSPISPRLSLNLLAALVGWVLLGLLLVLILENFDRSIKGPAQLAERLDLVTIGMIPLLQKGRRSTSGDQPVKTPDRYILENPSSSAAEAIRTLRTNLLFMAPEQSLRSLLVTSAEPSEGKTSTCANIGVAMAAAGSRVLIVDSDLRRPRLHKIFGFANHRGLTDLLLDRELGLDEVVIESEFENLDVLCSGRIPPNPVELLQSQSFRDVLKKILDAYDQVIFDSPPVVPVTDAQVLGHQLDGAILVIRANQSSIDMVSSAVRRLRDVKANLLGGVINGCRPGRSGYQGYYYSYSYTSKDDARSGLEEQV